MLGKIVSEQQRDWDNHVAYVLAAYNATEHNATGYTPNMLVYGRELRFPNELMYTDVGNSEVIQISSVAYVAERQVLFQKAFTLAREMLEKAAERSKKRYDMRVKATAYKVGDWIYYFCPRHRVSRSPKWQRFYSGPFLVTEVLGPVNVRIQKSPRANPMVVHVNKVKQCMGETPASWLDTQTYNIIPPIMGFDVLPIMFGEVDRSGVSTSADDVEPNVIVRPKRNAGVPARFLSRTYVVWDNAPSHICKPMCVERVINNELFLPRYTDMKKAAKNTDLVYRCFLCLKQDDKARLYTRSYDLILHMVNTHKKYPNDVKHNTFYPADGTNLRDATAEEVKKYRLAATHKRRRPEVEAPRDKTETTACATRGDKKDDVKTNKRDESKHRDESGRQRDKIPETRNKSTEEKSGRTTSQDSRKGDEGSRSRGRNEGMRRESERRHGDRLSDQEEKGGGDAVELDEDERDRRKMAEIRRRIDERITAKSLEIKNTDKTVHSPTVPAASDMTKKGARGNPDAAKKGGEEKNSGSRKKVEENRCVAQCSVRG